MNLNFQLCMKIWDENSEHTLEIIAVPE